MSQTKELNVSLEDVRCASCRNYLSCAPILVLSDGKSVCGNCAPLYANEVTQRVLTLEAILSKFIFPCQFTHHGCKNELLFGQVNQHEADCNFRSFNCPFLPNNCLWRGPVSQIHNHFVEAHPEAVVDNIEVKLDVNQGKKGIVTLEVENVRFVMKYVYCLETSRFLYEIKYAPSNVEQVSCKIMLKNEIEEGYTITLKGNSCLPYDGHFLNLQNPDGLCLNNLLPVLNKPDHILITIDLLVQTAGHENEVPKHESHKLIVDYDLLEKLRCKECREYLTPPIYKIEGTAGFVCCTCRVLPNGYVLLENNTMLQRWVAHANYPCRWRGCDRVEKAHDIRRHELKFCQYRMYECFFTGCKEIFKMEAAVAHILGHGYQHFKDDFVYKFVLSQPHGYEWGFSQKCNEIVFVRYNTDIYDSLLKREFKHKIVIRDTPSAHKTKIKAEVQFEHPHCKIKSQKYLVSKCFGFCLNDMPRCFRIDDELTVTLRLRCCCSICF